MGLQRLNAGGHLPQGHGPVEVGAEPVPPLAHGRHDLGERVEEEARRSLHQGEIENKDSKIRKIPKCPRCCSVTVP